MSEKYGAKNKPESCLGFRLFIAYKILGDLNHFKAGVIQISRYAVV